mmetsp:Transcript_81943/g.237652  ORF Transcript_81943/g.237652 Transcript_81943/m.237652 type:complete len:83 (+) Transcript_81943:523-771(+)
MPRQPSRCPSGSISSHHILQGKTTHMTRVAGADRLVTQKDSGSSSLMRASMRRAIQTKTTPSKLYDIDQNKYCTLISRVLVS